MHPARPRSATKAAHDRRQRAEATTTGSGLGVALVALLVAVYAIVFFSCRLTSAVHPDTGEPLVRGIFWLEALLPERMVTNWLGGDLPLGFRDRLPIAAAAAAIWLVAWGMGRLALAGLKLDRAAAPLERTVLAAGVGANLFSLYVLLMGLAGLLGRIGLFGPPALATAAALGVEVGSWHRRSPVAEGDRPTSLPGAWRRTWLWLVPGVLFAAMILLSAVLPPLDFDVLEYHLQAPRSFIKAAASRSWSTTFMPPCRWGPRCSTWPAWCSPGIGGRADWPASWQ